MESYQGSDIAAQEQTLKPIKAAAIVGGSLLGGTSLLARAMPLLSRFIGQSTAIKGLSKLSPKMGKFIKSGMASGYTFDEIKKFLEEEFEKEKEPQHPRNAREAMTMNIAKANSRRTPSELSRESLMEQFQKGQQQPFSETQGKGSLAPLFSEAVQILRSLKRGG